MKPTATDFPDPGMLDHLKELAESEPFVPFAIRMQTGTKLHVAKAQDIHFTHCGSPKILSVGKGKHDNPEDFAERKRWHILNVDAIAEIIL
jgi:hypothetical protein